jgi:hypothetical protein
MLRFQSFLLVEKATRQKLQLRKGSKTDYRDVYKVNGQHVEVLFTHLPWENSKKAYAVDFKVNHRFSRGSPKFDAHIGHKILFSVLRSMHNFRKKHRSTALHFIAGDNNAHIRNRKKTLYGKVADRMARQLKGKSEHRPTVSIVHMPKRGRRKKITEGKDFEIEGDKQAWHVYKSHKKIAGHQVDTAFTNYAPKEYSFGYKVNNTMSRGFSQAADTEKSKKILYHVNKLIHKFIRKEKPKSLLLTAADYDPKELRRKTLIYRMAAKRIAAKHKNASVENTPKGSQIHFK